MNTQQEQPTTTGVYSIKIQHKRNDDYPDGYAKRMLAAKQHLLAQASKTIFDGRSYYLTSKLESSEIQDEFQRALFFEKILNLELYLSSLDQCQVGELFIDLERKIQDDYPPSHAGFSHGDKYFLPIRDNIWQRVA